MRQHIKTIWYEGDTLAPPIGGQEQQHHSAATTAADLTIVLGYSNLLFPFIILGAGMVAGILLAISELVRESLESKISTF